MTRLLHLTRRPSPFRAGEWTMAAFDLTQAADAEAYAVTARKPGCEVATVEVEFRAVEMEEGAAG